MTVGELRQALEGVPDDIEVLVLSDIMDSEALMTPSKAKAETVRDRGDGLFWWSNEGQPAFVID